MRAPFSGPVYLGRSKPSATEVMLERAIGCGERPLLCYKIGRKWAHLLYAPTLTVLRVPVAELENIFLPNRLEPFLYGVRPLWRFIRNRAERFEAFDVGFSKSVVREVLCVLEAVAKEAEQEPRGEGAADPAVSQARDARPDQVHPKGKA